MRKKYKLEDYSLILVGNRQKAFEVLFNDTLMRILFSLKMQFCFKARAFLKNIKSHVIKSIYDFQPYPPVAFREMGREYGY